MESRPSRIRAFDGCCKRCECVTKARTLRQVRGGTSECVLGQSVGVVGQCGTLFFKAGPPDAQRDVAARLAPAMVVDGQPETTVRSTQLSHLGLDGERTILGSLVTSWRKRSVRRPQVSDTIYRSSEEGGESYVLF